MKVKLNWKKIKLVQKVMSHMNNERGASYWAWDVLQTAIKDVTGDVYVENHRFLDLQYTDYLLTLSKKQLKKINRWLKDFDQV